MFYRIRKYFTIKRNFRRVLKDMIKINEKDVKALHVSHYFGFVVDIYRFSESRFDRKELSTVYYLKGTDIVIHLNSSKSQGYYIEFKDEDNLPKTDKTDK